MSNDDDGRFDNNPFVKKENGATTIGIPESVVKSGINIYRFIQSVRHDSIEYTKVSSEANISEIIGSDNMNSEDDTNGSDNTTDWFNFTHSFGDEGIISGVITSEKPLHPEEQREVFVELSRANLVKGDGQFDTGVVIEDKNVDVYIDSTCDFNLEGYSKAFKVMYDEFELP